MIKALHDYCVFIYTSWRSHNETESWVHDKQLTRLERAKFVWAGETDLCIFNNRLKVLSLFGRHTHTEMQTLILVWIFRTMQTEFQFCLFTEKKTKINRQMDFDMSAAYSITIINKTSGNCLIYCWDLNGRHKINCVCACDNVLYI